MVYNINMKEYIKEYLIANYEKEDTTWEQMCQDLNLKENTIRCYGTRLGLKKFTVNHNTLPKEEQDLIFEHYEYGDLDWLCKKLNKNKHALNEWARKRGLKRKVSSTRKSDVKFFMIDELETYYWLGVMAADGYFSSKGHIMLSQGEKDKELVESLAEKAEGKVYEYEVQSGYSEKIRKTYRFNSYDKEVCNYIRNLWGLKEIDQKTYTKLNYDFLNTPDKFKAYLIGFCNGDGGFRETGHIKLECHSSVFNFMELINSHFMDNLKPVINKKGYAQIGINKKECIHLKEFLLKHNLPYHARKWDKIKI